MIFVFVKIGKFANVSSGKDRVKRRLGFGRCCKSESKMLNQLFIEINVLFLPKNNLQKIPFCNIYFFYSMQWKWRKVQKLYLKT